MYLEDEIMTLRRTIERYPNYNFSYIPHRDERQEKLDTINKLGYQIKKLGKPAEIFFDETDVMPEFVFSYYSTTLYTCYIRFCNLHIISINVERLILKKNSKVSAREIYQYYNDLGIDTLELN